MLTSRFTDSTPIPRPRLLYPPTLPDNPEPQEEFGFLAEGEDGQRAMAADQLCGEHLRTGASVPDNQPERPPYRRPDEILRRSVHFVPLSDRGRAASSIVVTAINPAPWSARGPPGNNGVESDRDPPLSLGSCGTRGLSSREASKTLGLDELLQLPPSQRPRLAGETHLEAPA